MAEGGNNQLITLEGYDGQNNAVARITDCARRILLSPENSVLILGEGDYSFAIALASLRSANWENLYVSKYHEEKIPEYVKIVINNQEAAIIYQLKTKYDQITSGNLKSELPSEIQNILKEYLSQQWRPNANQVVELVRQHQDQSRLQKAVDELFQHDASEEEKFMTKMQQSFAKSIHLAEKDILRNFKNILVKLNELAFNKPVTIPPVDRESLLVDSGNSIDLGSNTGGWISQKVDAKILPRFVFKGKEFFPRALVFQCPWISRNKKNDSTHELITKLFESANKQAVNPPDYIFIGVVNDSFYLHNYGLEELLGPPVASKDSPLPIFKSASMSAKNSTCCKENYDFIGVDDAFAKHILLNGYTHKAEVGDIHQSIRDKHIMLCFQRKDAPITAQMAEMNLNDSVVQQSTLSSKK